MTNRAEVSDIVHHDPIQKDQTMSYSSIFFQPGGATSTKRSIYLTHVKKIGQNRIKIGYLLIKNRLK
jgi:hypothetical protein